MNSLLLCFQPGLNSYGLVVICCRRDSISVKVKGRDANGVFDTKVDVKRVVHTHSVHRFSFAGRDFSG